MEIPAANGLSTGRGLAKVAAVLAGHGAVGETRLFSQETYRRAMAGEVKMYDDILMVRSGTDITWDIESTTEQKRGLTKQQTRGHHEQQPLYDHRLFTQSTVYTHFALVVTPPEPLRFSFTEGWDVAWGVTSQYHSRWTQGGMCNMRGLVGHKGFYGWCGWGGNFIVFNPEAELAVGLAVTGMKHDLMVEERIQPILAALLAALPALVEAGGGSAFGLRGRL